MTYSKPKPPSDEGQWTLLQSRPDRSFWQWDRQIATESLSHFVILRGEDRYDYDTFDEAEALFFALDEEEGPRALAQPLAFESL